MRKLSMPCKNIFIRTGVGRAVALLAEEREVALVGLAADLDQQRPGAAGGVTDGVALPRRKQAGQQRRNLSGV
jgi:hypothetical protein